MQFREKQQDISDRGFQDMINLVILVGLNRIHTKRPDGKNAAVMSGNSGIGLAAAKQFVE